MNGEVREIAAIVPMPRLLESLGFQVNERTRRGPCLISSHAHGGLNRSVFSWRDDGFWYCFSRAIGGDRIALVRAVRGCSFRDAIEFLAALAGVAYQPERFSGAEIRRAKDARKRAERNAWWFYDEIIRLRSYYGETLRRCERLQARIGNEMGSATANSEQEAVWSRLARLASASTHFLSGWNFVSEMKPDVLARFVAAQQDVRRELILGLRSESKENVAA